MSFADLAARKMSPKFIEFVTRNRVSAGACSDAYAAVNEDLPLLLRRVKDSIGGSLVFLEHVDEAVIAQWIDLPPLRQRAFAVADALKTLAQGRCETDYLRALMIDVSAVDNILGTEW